MHPTLTSCSWRRFTVATHTTAANCEGAWKCKTWPWLASNPYTTTTLTCRAHHLQSWCPTHASTHAIMHTPPTSIPLLTPLSAPNELLTSIDVLSSIQLSCNIPLHAYLTNLNPQPQMQKQAQPANILIPSSLTTKTKPIISPPLLPICLGFEFHPERNQNGLHINLSQMLLMGPLFRQFESRLSHCSRESLTCSFLLWKFKRWLPLSSCHWSINFLITELA